MQQVRAHVDDLEHGAHLVRGRAGVRVKVEG